MTFLNPLDVLCNRRVIYRLSIKSCVVFWFVLYPVLAMSAVNQCAIHIKDNNLTVGLNRRNKTISQCHILNDTSGDVSLTYTKCIPFDTFFNRSLKTFLHQSHSELHGKILPSSTRIRAKIGIVNNDVEPTRHCRYDSRLFDFTDNWLFTALPPFE